MKPTPNATRTPHRSRDGPRITLAQAEAEIEAARANLERAKQRLNFAHGTAQRLRQRQPGIDRTQNTKGKRQ